MWALSQDWYGDRLNPSYTPKTVSVLQGFLTDAGLATEFWQLTG